MPSENVPEGWTLTTIADLNFYTSSNMQPAKHPDSVFELYSVPIFPTGQPEILEANEIGSSKQFVLPKDVLLCKINPRINRVWVVETRRENDQIASSEWIVVRQPYVSEVYLVWYFRSEAFRNLLCADVSGVGGSLTRAQPKKVATFPVPLPPEAEQKVIADKLDTLLAQVETTKARLERVPTLLKTFRQSVLAAAVSGRLTEADSEAQAIKVEDTWSHEVVGPKHWSAYRFSEVVRIIGGSQPPKSEFSSEMRDGYIRLIQIRDYKSDAHKVYIPISKAKRFVSKADVMIGRYGPPIFQILRGLDGAYNVALMKAEPNEELLDKEYLYWYLKNQKLFNYINAGSDRTAGQSGVNKKHLESYPVLLPPIKEQTEIVRQVEKLFAHADKIEQQANAALARVNNLTQSILAKAFRGELTADWRAANPDLISGENSAEALLAKIKAEREALRPKKKARTKKAKA